jgi:hypothetical protein
MSKVWSALRLAAICGLLLLTAYIGVVEGLNTAPSAATTGQYLATATQLLYGVLSIASLVAMGLKHRSAGVLLALWGLAVTATAGLASVAWGGSSILVGLVASGATAAIAGLVFWGWRAHRTERSRSAARPPPGGRVA